ncbi:MAG: electron transfer flavoprotein subunit alpha/FixB family protein, partial [Burkholderiales bacterium]
IGQISEIVAIVSPQVFKRFSYTGNVLMETESLEEIKLLTVRAPNFEAEARLRNTPAEIINLAYTGQASSKIKLVSRNIIDKSVDLSSAKVVVSGGIALGSKQNFDELIRTLATKLTAAVGATRAAVEAGYAPNDCQVGQTGKIVAPEVYLAIGMSGAVQHIAGMKDSKTVIAINADRTAAIFDYADYGLVGDLFALIPELIAKV